MQMEESTAMKNGAPHEPSYRFGPVTPETWGDFEALFEPRGACGGCWCMWWRLTRKEFNAGKGSENRAAMKALVDGGHVPGLLAFDGDTPVGWCSVASREFFPRILTSRTLRPIDELPVWSAVCFFIHKEYRRRGLAVALLGAAADYAGSQGATILEGYPNVDPPRDLPPAFLYTGTVSLFARAGFHIAAQHGKSRAIMRKTLV